jgi:hypothetical protein
MNTTPNDSPAYKNWESLLTEINAKLIEIETAFSLLLKEESEMVMLGDAVIGMHNLKSDMSLVYDNACKLMVEKMGDIPEINLPGGHKVEKKSGADRKAWDHAGLARNVASRINDMAIDMDTGEIALTPQDMMMKMLEFAAVSYWRVKELSKIGISADDFCEVSEGKTNIIVRKAK